MVRLPRFQMVMLTEPDAIRTMFASKGDDLHAGKVNTILRAIVGSSSVLLLDGAEHMRHRKLLLPSFHGERMRFYGETMADIARQSIATWPDHDVFALHERRRTSRSRSSCARCLASMKEPKCTNRGTAYAASAPGENPLFCR